ncbi:LON peptidase substrate-binding domain-containing protein [soil metagenome]
MDEALEKVKDIEHLPLFPLPLVLLPNELLPLHIFEPRYRQMLADAQAETNMFGVSFFDFEAGFDVKPEVGTVGCVAEIREVQTMPDARSNIITSGLVRYRVLEYVDLGVPYLIAHVGFFVDEPEEPGILQPLSDEVFSLFERVAKAAFQMSGNRGPLPEIPQAEPEQLSFLVTAAFNLENELKYSLLSMTSTYERLERLKEILDQAVGQMEQTADVMKAAQSNGHSKKKLDI